MCALCCRKHTEWHYTGNPTCMAYCIFCSPSWTLGSRGKEHVFWIKVNYEYSFLCTSYPGLGIVILGTESWSHLFWFEGVIYCAYISPTQLLAFFSVCHLDKEGVHTCDFFYFYKISVNSHFGTLLECCLFSVWICVGSLLDQVGWCITGL